MNPNVNTPMPLLATLETFMIITKFFEKTQNTSDAQRLAFETFKRSELETTGTKTIDGYLLIAEQILKEEVSNNEENTFHKSMQKLSKITGSPWPPPKGFSSSGIGIKYIKDKKVDVSCEAIESAIDAHIRENFDLQSSGRTFP